MFRLSYTSMRVFIGLGACFSLSACHARPGNSAETDAQQTAKNTISATSARTATVIPSVLIGDAAPPRYKIVDLNKRMSRISHGRFGLHGAPLTFKGLSSQNDLFVGISRGKYDHLACLHNGSLHDLGVLQEDLSSINKHWQGVGSYTAGREGDGFVEVEGKRVVAPGDMAYRNIFHAFLWERGKLRDLGTLPGGNNSRAECINDREQVVGTADRGDHNYPVVWKKGKIAVLPPGDEPGEAAWINNQSDIVGNIYSQGADIACLWRNNKLILLGTLGGNGSAAKCINNRGDIVGDADAQYNHSHAFLYRNGTMQDLGTLPGYEESYAACINDTGDIIGRAINARHDKYCAVLWHNGILYDLNTLVPPGSPWKLTGAGYISDTGYIVSSGVRDREQRTLILEPQENRYDFFLPQSLREAIKTTLEDRHLLKRTFVPSDIGKPACQR